MGFLGDLFDPFDIFDFNRDGEHDLFETLVAGIVIDDVIFDGEISREIFGPDPSNPPPPDSLDAEILHEINYEPEYDDFDTYEEDFISDFGDEYYDENYDEY